MNTKRLTRALSVAVLVVVAASCRALPTHEENGPSAKLDIVAFGDSYTAGNGAGPGGSYYHYSEDDPRDTDELRHLIRYENWHFNLPSPQPYGCLRHPGNYSRALYNELSSSGAYINGACSGDTTHNVAGVNNAPAQMAGFTVEQRNEVDIVTLTMGGNDLGFASIIQKCFYEPTRVVTQCRDLLDNADAMMNSSAQYSIVQDGMLAGLNHAKNTFPNAKIILVGYPLFWEDETLSLSCGPLCTGVNPGERLEWGLNILNAQQQEIINDLNATNSGRFAFLPLHGGNNDGPFDGHGLHGAEDDWINSPGNVAQFDYREEWFHPNAAGHAAIAQELKGMPIVQAALREALLRDFPTKTIAEVDGQWYALDENRSLWRVNGDFTNCDPGGGYVKANWVDPTQILDAGTNSGQTPYPVKSLTCEPRNIDTGDILYVYDSGTQPIRGIVSFGPNGEKYVTFVQSEIDYECLKLSGSEVFDIDFETVNSEYQLAPTSYEVPPCDPPSTTGTTDSDTGLVYVVDISETSPGIVGTAYPVTHDWMLACIGSPGAVDFDDFPGVTISGTPYEHEYCTPAEWKNTLIEDAETGEVWYVAHHGMKYQMPNSTVQDCMLNSEIDVIEVEHIDAELIVTGGVLSDCIA